MIVIGCPVRNRAWVLPEYLQAISAIDWPDKRYLFVENNSTDGTRKLLQRFSPGPLSSMYDHHPDNPPDHRRGWCAKDDQHAYLAKVRNYFLYMFHFTNAEYLLSIDSDIIASPDILQKLMPLANQQTIVGAAVSNIPGKPLDGNTAGNFMFLSNGKAHHPMSHKLSGLLRVDVVGACYLIPRAVLEAGVRYEAHPQGEDVAFCMNAIAKGFKMIVNLDCKPEHRMTEV